MGWNTGSKAFTTSAAVLAKRLVKYASTGLVAHNTAADADAPIGVTEYSVASGDIASVKLLNDGGTFEVTAAGVIALNADVYPAADGKISATVVPGKRIGKAIEAATADGDIIEILPIKGGADAVQTATAAAAVIIPGSTTYLDSTSNAINGTLADDTVPGRLTTIVMQQASNSSTISIAHHVTSDPEVATFDAVDETLVLVWTGTEYATVHASATFV